MENWRGKSNTLGLAPPNASQSWFTSMWDHGFADAGRHDLRPDRFSRTCQVLTSGVYTYNRVPSVPLEQSAISYQLSALSFLIFKPPNTPFVPLLLRPPQVIKITLFRLHLFPTFPSGQSRTYRRKGTCLSRIHLCTSGLAIWLTSSLHPPRPFPAPTGRERSLPMK